MGTVPVGHRWVELAGIIEGFSSKRHALADDKGLESEREVWSRLLARFPRPFQALLNSRGSGPATQERERTQSSSFLGKHSSRGPPQQTSFQQWRRRYKLAAAATDDRINSLRVC